MPNSIFSRSKKIEDGQNIFELADGIGINGETNLTLIPSIRNE